MDTKNFGFLESFTSDTGFIEQCRFFMMTTPHLHAMEFHSGGGCCHLFLLDKKGHVHSIHNVDGDEDGGYVYEVSFKKYDSVNDYLDDEESGFGFESYQPNYEFRHGYFKNGKRTLLSNEKTIS